jgi:hypothetical protein
MSDALASMRLGGVALVFPIIMLMQMLSAGAMGGGISGAVSRALGAGDEARAQAIALAAATIGLVAGLGSAVCIWRFGARIYALLGGTGAVAGQASIYSNVAALGILAIWLTSSLASVARGSGNMVAPAAITLAGADVTSPASRGWAAALMPPPPFTVHWSGSIRTGRGSSLSSRQRSGRSAHDQLRHEDDRFRRFAGDTPEQEVHKMCGACEQILAYG